MLWLIKNMQDGCFRSGTMKYICGRQSIICKDGKVLLLIDIVGIVVNEVSLGIFF